MKPIHLFHFLFLPAAGLLSAQTPLLIPTPLRPVTMQVVRRADGGTTTFKSLERPAVIHKGLVADAKAAPARRLPVSPRVFAVIGATIYPDGTTELRWRAGASGELVARSNVDFRLLTGVASLEHLGLRFEFLIFPQGPELPGRWNVPARPVPLRLRTQTTAQFVLESEARTADAGALAAMQALHAYVEANRARLMAEHAAREVAREAARRERVRAAQAAPLAPPRQEVIHFWKVLPEDIPPEAKARMQGAAAAQAVSTQETEAAR